MTREEFSKVVEEAVEKLVTTAEQRINAKLPRKYCLGGLGSKDVIPDDMVGYLVNWVFVDETHIYPCVDLFLDEILPDGRLRFSAYRAGYPPCRYGEHITYKLEGHDCGRVGPFKIGCYNFVERLSPGAMGKLK